MSEINNFSDYASKYNTNVDYSYLFGGTQTSSAGGAINLADYAAIKNGSYGKLLKAYYAKQDAEQAATSGDSVQKSTLMKTGADALKKSADALNNDELWEKKKIKKKDETTGEEIEVEDYDWDSITKAVKSFSIMNAAARSCGTYKVNGKYSDALSELVSSKVDKEI